MDRQTTKYFSFPNLVTNPIAGRFLFIMTFFSAIQGISFPFMLLGDTPWIYGYTTVYRTLARRKSSQSPCRPPRLRSNSRAMNLWVLGISALGCNKSHAAFSSSSHTTADLPHLKPNLLFFLLFLSFSHVSSFLFHLVCPCLAFRPFFSLDLLLGCSFLLTSFGH